MMMHSSRKTFIIGSFLIPGLALAIWLTPRWSYSFLDGKIFYTPSIQNTSNHLMGTVKEAVGARILPIDAPRSGDIRTNHPYILIKDKVGNRSFVFTWAFYPWLSRKVATFKSNIEIWNKPQRVETCTSKDSDIWRAA